MTPGVTWRPQAVDELVAAVRWYDEQRPGLGDAFADACRAAVDLVASRPLLFATIHGPIRRVLLRRFPYAVFYLAEERGTVVLGVMHERRDPKAWRSRR